MRRPRRPVYPRILTLDDVLDLIALSDRPVAFPDRFDRIVDRPRPGEYTPTL